jgi:hypothetical protein
MSEIPLGAEVECLDGPCGKTISIIINPTNKDVTHIVVGDKKLGDDEERLIPIEHLGETAEKRARLPQYPDSISKDYLSFGYSTVKFHTRALYSAKRKGNGDTISPNGTGPKTPSPPR